MKLRFTVLSLVAALAVVALVTGAALAQDLSYDTPQGRVIVPSSSIERPGDIGLRAHTNFVYMANADSSVPPPAAETPGSLACIYHLVAPTTGCPIATAKTLPNKGAKVIALVDAYDNPDATKDLSTFSAQFGLPTANFQQVYATGKQPANNPGGWSLEEALDIEMAHASAPNAEIILVEAATNSFADLYFAEQVAANLVAAAGGGEVSNSWSGGEYSTELADETTYFTTPGVVYFASTGDSGLGAIGVPAVFASVVAAGGTSVKRTGGNFTTEWWWTGGGGGTSFYEPLPNYQKGRSGITGSKREIPDISSDADPNTGPAMYDLDGGYLWLQIGGTSVSSPYLAGVINGGGHFKTSSKAELSSLYNEYSNATMYKKLFRDVTLGGTSCKTGWDICTGIGSPIGYGGK